MRGGHWKRPHEICENPKTNGHICPELIVEAQPEDVERDPVDENLALVEDDVPPQEDVAKTQVCFEMLLSWETSQKQGKSEKWSEEGGKRVWLECRKWGFKRWGLKQI